MGQHMQGANGCTASPSLLECFGDGLQRARFGAELMNWQPCGPQQGLDLLATPVRHKHVAREVRSNPLRVEREISRKRHHHAAGMYGSLFFSENFPNFTSPN